VLALAAVLVAGSVAATALPGRVLAALALGLTAAVSLIAIRAISTTTGPPARSTHRAEAPAQIEQLRQVERAILSAPRSSFALDRELRPLLRPIAAMLLARRGIELDREDDRAREALGVELWELVRPGRDSGADRGSGGIAPTDLERMVERLESL
jgi:hypothetical protein